MHDFDKLWNRTHDHEAKLCAFDLLELDGEDYRSNPCRKARRIMGRPGARSDCRWLPSSTARPRAQ
jgi:hypothetical protein